MTSHQTFMRSALDQAEAALAAGEFPVGCVITDGTDILAAGGRGGSRQPRPDETGHAEIMALKNLFQRPGPVDVAGLTIYSTLEPCLMCFGAILIHGIDRIVYACEDVMGGGTGCDLAGLPSLYRNRTITIIPGVLRQESLDLLRSFFSDSRHDYLRQTELAEFVLNPGFK
ncbi:MAG: nucleoside deaminase [Desulfosudaceae bacterium]